MTSAEIIQLGTLGEDDDEWESFIESLKENVTRVVFIAEKKDGSVSVGTNSTDKRDVVIDFYRLHQFCQDLINGNTPYGDKG